MQSDLNRLISTFNQMNEDGFDTDNYLKWGFFFIDIDKQKLELLYEELKDSNYKLDSIEKLDEGGWMLRVNKIDVLDPHKLHKRNLAFNALAEHLSVSLYDGWDVEKLK